MAYDALDWTNGEIPFNAPGLANAVIESATEPAGPHDVGQRWRNTTFEPDALLGWDGTQFVALIDAENLERIEQGISEAHAGVATATPPLIVIRSVTTTPYTVVATDHGAFIRMNLAGANVVNVDTNAVVPIPPGTSVTFKQLGTGVTTLVPATGVTMRREDNGALVPAGTGTAFAARYREINIIKNADPDFWDVSAGLA